MDFKEKNEFQDVAWNFINDTCGESENYFSLIRRFQEKYPNEYCDWDDSEHPNTSQVIGCFKNVSENFHQIALSRDFAQLLVDDAMELFDIDKDKRFFVAKERVLKKHPNKYDLIDFQITETCWEVFENSYARDWKTTGGTE